MRQSMELQTVKHNLANEQQQDIPSFRTIFVSQLVLPALTCCHCQIRSLSICVCDTSMTTGCLNPMVIHLFTCEN